MKKLNTLQVFGVYALLLAAAGFLAACSNPFKPELKGIIIDRETLYIEKGHSATLKAIGIPSTAEVKSVTWTVYPDPTPIVSFNSGKPECDIYASDTGVVFMYGKDDETLTRVQCRVTVVDIQIDDTYVNDLTNKRVAIRIKAINDAYNPFNGGAWSHVDYNVIWSSSNPGAAAVHKTDGTITPTKDGGSTVITAEVTIESDKFTVTKTVTVLPHSGM
ncbi:MAG: hypothetical protein LBU85_12095 [Treponema sp.]|jgi:hypothetical protein|nr:hypothetical protein [Treponema sp.]